MKKALVSKWRFGLRSRFVATAVTGVICLPVQCYTRDREEAIEAAKDAVQAHAAFADFTPRIVWPVSPDTYRVYATSDRGIRVSIVVTRTESGWATDGMIDVEGLASP